MGVTFLCLLAQIKIGQIGRLCRLSPVSIAEKTVDFCAHGATVKIFVGTMLAVSKNQLL